MKYILFTCKLKCIQTSLSVLHRPGLFIFSCITSPYKILEKKYYLHSHLFLFIIYKLAIINETKIISSNNTSVLIFICFTPIFVHFWMFASMTLAYPPLLLTVFHPFHLPRALLCTHQRYSVLICKVLLHVVASLNIQVCLRCPFSRDPLHGHRLSSIAKRALKCS